MAPSIGVGGNKKLMRDRQPPVPREGVIPQAATDVKRKRLFFRHISNRKPLYPNRPSDHITAMAVIDVVRMGHPVLLQRAAPVEDPTAPDVRALVVDMVDSLAAAGGIGLAAPQIGVSKRVVIFNVPPDRDTREGGDGAVPMTVMINPEIEPRGDEVQLSFESCLSVPGMTGVVPRYARIVYRYRDLDGQPHEVEAHDFHARVVQHECDHLDGILYPFRMPDLRSFGFVEEVRERLAQAQE